MNDGNHFARDGYAVLAGLVPKGTARAAALYALLNRNLPDYYSPERDYNSWGRYADALGESLLVESQPAIEKAIGLSLFPTYSYLRVYCTGSVLPAHTDRPSCEISVTLTLGGEAREGWPIWVQAKAGARAVDLPAGDAMVYRGAVLPHWRERFAGRLWVQLFLHYVRRDGRYADCRFDGRVRLGPIVPGADPRPRKRFAADDPCPCGSGRRFADCHGAAGGGKTTDSR